jgi:primosomal protein N''
MNTKELIEKHEAIIETLEDIASAQRARAIVESSRKSVEGMFTEIHEGYRKQLEDIDKQLSRLKSVYEKQISN